MSDPPDRSAPPPDQPLDEPFADFYRRFIAILVAFLMWQGARLADATDIAQEVMMKAYRHWPDIRSPEAWVRRVAYRELARRIPPVRGLEDLCSDPPECALLRESNDIETWEEQHEVLRLLRRLPLRQRQVLAWTILADRTPSEIADELGITPDAVRASLMFARRAIAGYLGETGRSDERR